MSPGSKSGVNWMRLKSRPRAVAKLRAMSVLPRPGKSSNKTCPPASTEQITVSSNSRLPTTARSTSLITFWPIAATSRTFEIIVVLHLGFEVADHKFNVNIKRRRWNGTEAFGDWQPIGQRKLFKKQVAPFEG